MKRIILMLTIAISLGSLSAQEMTIRLQMPETPPAVGEDFFVEVWMDVLEYPGYPIQTEPTLKSGQMGITYDPAVLTPIKTGGAPPLQKYAWNLNGMFTDYGAVPAEALPTPGDLRFVSFTTLEPGMDPSFYGDEPFLMWELKFNYLGGDIEISWQDADKTTPVAPNISGGTKEKIVTFWTAWDNMEYAMTYVNIPEAVTAVTWEGDVSENWFDGTNWDGDVAPGAGDDVIIPASPVGPNMPAIWDYANVMGLENNGTITIDPGPGGLNSAALIMNGGELVNNGSIVMKSVLAPPGFPGSPSSTILGQIVPDIAGGISGTGTFEVQRYMNITTSGNPDYDGWHFLSSPVDGFSTDDIHNYFLNTWNETATGVDPDFPWVHVEGDPQVPCAPVSPALFADKMEGWSVKEDMDWDSYGCPDGTEDVIEMIGSAWAAPYETAVTLTGTTTHAGYNLVGNPYFCGLDLLSVDWVTNANVNPTAYVYEEYNQAYQPISGTIPDPWVGNTLPPTLGFMVMANVSGNFTLDGSEQTLAFGGVTKSTVDNTLIIKATSSSNYDYMRIHFMDEATSDFDNMWDAYKLFSTAIGVPQIFTPAGEDMLATNAMEATQMVPMHFKSASSGNFTIEAVETSNFSEVYLQDLVTGEVTDLLASDYSFAYTEGENQSRFIIHFAPVGINDINATTVNIWARNNNIIVNVPSNVTGEIAVYNMMGQQVVRTNIAGTETQVKVSDVNTNYVVKVISESNTVTDKVYVK